MKSFGGARFILERRSAPEANDQGPAVYAATVETNQATHHAQVNILEDGSVDVGPAEPALPADLLGRLTTFARLMARAAPTRRADGIAAWPARVTRWRPR
jgi:hypothetical protein